MRKYLVLTPSFDYMEVVIEGRGPVYSVRDFVEIVAKNKRDAVILAVHHMLHNSYPDGQGYQYVHDQRSDNCSPYAGVRAYDRRDLRDRRDI